MTKRFLTVIMAIGMVLAVLLCGSGCKDNPGQEKEPLPYNTELLREFADGEQRIVPTMRGGFSESFWRENMVQVSYLNENYDANSSDDRKYLYDATLPKDITHIVTAEEKYNQIFDYDASYWIGSVDFEKEMLVVYVYRGINGTKTIFTDVSLNGTELEIKYQYKIISNAYGTAPKRWIRVIKLDKIEVETVRFISLGKV